MQLKKKALVISLLLEICLSTTSALKTKRQFVRHFQFDGNSCSAGDAVKTVGNITTEIACMASCVESGCLDIFYFPGTNSCQSCYTFYSNDLLPAVYLGISLHYKSALECPPSFVRYNTSCYMVTELQQTWDSAKAYCESLGAHLAIIEDVGENSFIGNYLEFGGVDSEDARIFIGLTDSQVENTWLTVNGGSQSYLPWSPYQPSEIPGVSVDKDCAAMAMETALKTWSDLPCSETHFAVCEMELF